jgi:FHA domain
MSGGNKSDDDATKVIFTKSDRGDQTLLVPSGRGASDGATLMVPTGAAASQLGAAFDPVVGWLVVVEGSGRGQFRPVYYGQNSIGRGHDLRISIDFGDQRISREAHAFLIYDDVERKYFVRDNGKSSIVRLNGNAVLAPTELHDRGLLTIGETTLLFVALCDPNFDWMLSNAPKTA